MDRITCCAQCQRHLTPYSVIGGRTELHCPVCDAATTIFSPSVIPEAASNIIPSVGPRSVAVQGGKAFPAAA